MSQETPTPTQPERPRSKHFGRFDQSFFVRMTTEYLLFLILVVIFELGLRFAIVQYEFRNEAESNVKLAARQLSHDVGNIVLNRGGPMAARTVYPILKRNFERAGLEVAIEPSAVTVASIQRLFGFRPRGLPAVWPSGQYVEGREELRAEEFCLQCHSDARIGDVLGNVVVRDYLDSRISDWWKDVQLTSSVNAVKILINSVMLFVLLRSLMAPLLSLRAAVSRMAKGEHLPQIHAKVNSSDEFGELANDLNLFLHRVNRLLMELRRVASKVISMNDRLRRSTMRAKDQVMMLESSLLSAIPPAGTLNSSDPIATGLQQLADRFARLEPSVEVVEETPEPSQVALGDQIRQMQEGWEQWRSLLERLPHLIHRTHELRHTIEQVEHLEGAMNEIAESGKKIAERMLSRAPGSSTGAVPFRRRVRRVGWGECGVAVPAGPCRVA